MVISDEVVESVIDVGSGVVDSNIVVSSAVVKGLVIVLTDVADSENVVSSASVVGLVVAIETVDTSVAEVVCGLRRTEISPLLDSPFPALFIGVIAKA